MSPEGSGDPAPPARRTAGGVARLGWAALAAVAVLGLNLSAQVPAAQVPAAGGALAAAAVAVALLAVRPLTPRGDADCPARPAERHPYPRARGRRFGAEVYLPYLLVERYAFAPTLAA